MTNYISQSREVEVLPWGTSYEIMAPTAERLGALGFVFKVWTGDDIYKGGAALPELELFDHRYRSMRVWPGEYIVVDGYRRFHIISSKRELDELLVPTTKEKAA